MAEITLKEYLEKNGDRRVDLESLDAIARPVGRVWIPKPGDTYWTVPEFGDMLDYVWDGGSEDAAAYSTGNCFPTLDAAEFEWERRKVVTELQRLADEAGAVDWLDRKTTKVCLDYDRTNGFMGSSVRTSCRIQGAIFFPSEEVMRAAVKLVGENRIKKYLFGVTE